MSAIKEKDKKYNLHSWSAQNKVDPIVVTKAEGLYFWDELQPGTRQQGYHRCYRRTGSEDPVHGTCFRYGLQS